MNDLIPDDHVTPSIKLNLAPMIDFLFIMLCVYAVLAVSRSSHKETRIDLVKLKQEKTTNISEAKRYLAKIYLGISATGEYNWMSEKENCKMATIAAIQAKFEEKLSLGQLPKEKEKTEVLLSIDSRAPWKNIAELLFAIRELGYEARPMYAPKK